MTARAKWEPPIAFERLQVMIDALHGSTAIDSDLRSEIADALDCFYVTLMSEAEQRTRGRRDAFATWMAAAIVRDLVDIHGATVKAAVAVVSPRIEFNDRVARAYRKLKSREAPGSVSRVNPDLLAKYAARLRSGNN